MRLVSVVKTLCRVLGANENESPLDGAPVRPRTLLTDRPRSSTSILLAMDVSRSMCSTDVDPNRLIVAQEAARTFVRGLCQHFVEIHISTDLATCEQRDPKGLYKKARAGQLKGFTGVDDPYEAPTSAELTLDVTSLSPQEVTAQLIDYLAGRGILKK